MYEYLLVTCILLKLVLVGQCVNLRLRDRTQLMVFLYDISSIRIHLLDALNELACTSQVEETLQLHRELTATLIENEVNVKVSLSDAHLCLMTGDGPLLAQHVHQPYSLCLVSQSHLCLRGNEIHLSQAEHEPIAAAEILPTSRIGGVVELIDTDEIVARSC